jgi:hypothetical protein
VRNHSRSYRSLVVILAAHLLLAPAPLGAQTFVTPSGEAQNVRFEQRESGIVEIFYDLIASDPRAVFTVALEGSQDNGSTWSMRPKTMTGDVGPGIRPGTAKKIVWDSGKDMERIQFNSLRFRMVATGGQLAANTAKPAAPAGGQQAVNQASGGGSRKKLLIIGGGVVAAGATAAVVLAGAGTASAPTVSNSSIVGNSGTLLAAVSPLTFVVTVSNPEKESLTASFNFGDGTTGSAAVSASGEATASKTYSTAGTFNPTVTINGGKGGAANASFPAVTVASLTGRWTGNWSTGLTATLNIAQNGSTLSGDATINNTTFANPARITGTVAGPASVTMRLTGTDGGFYDITVTGSGALSRFEGTATGATAISWSMTRQ